jgi:hypothetical protein
MATVTVPIWQNLVDGIVRFLEDVGQEAELQTRNLKAPEQNEVDSRIEFTTFAIIRKMAFDTEAGKTTFDGVDREQVFSDTAFIEYIPNVTAELFVLFQGKRFRIISVEDIGEIHGILSLKLTELGDATKAATDW